MSGSDVRRRAAMTGAAVLVAATIGTGGVAESQAAPAVPSAVPAAAAATATAPRVTLDGGDLRTLARPVVVRSARLGTGWVSVAVARAGLPAPGVAAVVVRVRASGATAGGRVEALPTGSRSTGRPVASYAATKTSDTLTLVKVGTDGALRVRATAGRPLVQISVVGYTSRLGAVTVPDAPISPVAVSARRTTATVALAGRAGVPRTATALILAVEATTSRSAKVAVWTPGAAVPSSGLALARGRQTLLTVAAPSADGRVSVRALSGSSSLRVRVIGWAVAGSTLEALARPTTAATVRAGRTTKVAIAARAGVPAGARSTLLGITAASGARVRVWASSSASGSPVLDVRSVGGAVTAWVPVPSGRAVVVKVTGTRKSTVVTALGFTTDLGSQKLSFVPRAGTVLLGTADVRVAGTATLDLAPSAPPVRVGGWVLARTADRAPFVAKVESVQNLSGGVRRAAVSAAMYGDAFADFDAAYHGQVRHRSAAAPSARAGRGPATGPSALPIPAGAYGVNLPFFSSEWWECAGDVPVAQVLDVDVDYDGDVNFDLDWGTRSLDVSAKGRLLFTFRFFGGASVSCTLSAAATEYYPRIPLGATGVAVQFGGDATLTATTPALSQGGTFTARAGLNVYAAFYYYDGTSGGTTTATPVGDIQAGYDGLQLALEPRLFVSVGPALPPGLDKVVSASGSIAVGARLAVARAPQMRGPRCIDVSLQPTISVGAEAAVDVFGIGVEVSFDGASWSGPETMLYQGPCWGWEGTVRYEVVGTSTPDCAGCGYVQRSNAATLTLVKEPARFLGDDIFQPYTWSATIAETTTGPLQGDPNPYRCTTSVSGTGTGVRTWGGTEQLPYDPFLVRDVATGPSTRTFFAAANEYPIVTTTTYGGGDASCMADTSAGTMFFSAAPDSSAQTLPFSSYAAPGFDWYSTANGIDQRVTYNLVRQEFDRR